MANVIEIIIRAKDEAAASIKKAAAEFNTLSTSGENLSRSTTGLLKEVGRVSPALDAVVAPALRLQGALNSDAPAKLTAQLQVVQQLGISSGSGLLALQKAAQDSGVSVNVLSTALTGFRARILAAQSGAGPAFEALSKLGFSAEQIRSGFGGAGQALAAVTPRLLAVKDASQQAALAATLFNKGGAQMIPVLQGAAAASGAAAAGIGSILVPALAVGAALALTAGASIAFARELGAAAAAGGRFADDTATMAERAGVSAESFSRLAFAAGQVDAPVSAMSAGLKFLNKNLFEAGAGSKEAEAAFRALGLTSADLKKVGADEAFLRIADRLSRVEDQSTRTGLALRIFGRGAEALVPLFAKSRVEVEAFGAELDALQGTVSESSGRIGDDFDNAMKRMKAAQRGVQIALADELLPSLTAVTTELSYMIAGVSRFVRASGQWIEGVQAMAKAGLSLAGLNLQKPGNDLALGMAKAVPVLRDVIFLLDLISDFKPPKPAGVPSAIANGEQSPLFADVKRGSDPAQNAGALMKRYEAELKAAEEAEKAAEAYRKKIAELRFEFEKAAAFATSIPAGVAEILFDVDPTKATKAVEALQKAFAEIEAVPIGVTADGAKLLASIEQQIRDTTLAIQVEVDPAARAKLLSELSKLEERAQRVGSGLRGLPTTPALALSGSALEKRDDPEGFAPLEGIDRASAGIAVVVEQLEAAGVHGEHLRDVLTESGETAFLFAAGFEGAFATLRDQLDPLANFMSDMSQAAGQVADGISNAIGGAFDDLILKGHKFTEALGAFATALGKLAINFISQVTAAIAKALVLKAILGSIGGFGIVGTIVNSIASAAKGGQVTGLDRGGSIRPAAAGVVAALALGGSIAPSAHASTLPHLAGGGAIVHAASGVRVIPGNAQAFDSVPAMLSPGEVVLPTIGGRSPGDLLAGLAQLGKDVGMLVARAYVPSQSILAGPGGNTTYNVSTIDADGLRSFVRRGGIAREEALASDPARD